jgi:hypothetical protein
MLEELSEFYITQLREQLWFFKLGSLHLFLADFFLVIFPIITHSYEYEYLLSLLGSFKELWKLEIM